MGKNYTDAEILAMDLHLGKSGDQLPAHSPQSEFYADHDCESQDPPPEQSNQQDVHPRQEQG